MLVDAKKVGHRVKIARKECKLTQAELGERINLCRVSVSQIENGKRRHINPDIIRCMAEVLKKPEAYFYDLPTVDQDSQQSPSTQKLTASLGKVIKKLVSLPEPQQNRTAHLIEELLAWREL